MMRNLLILSLLALTACAPNKTNPVPDPLPIIIPDGSVVARNGVVTLTNLEPGVGEDGALYLEGAGLVLLEPEKTLWNCKPLAPGWGCDKLPALLEKTPVTLKFTGEVRIGNLSYYLKKSDGTSDLKIKRLSK